MNRKIALVVWLTVFALLVFIGRSLTTQAAPNDTLICGNIVSNATWNTAGGPYHVCAPGATIMPGVTINIQPGVTVVFSSTARLTSRGTLNALGTPAQPITFTGALASPGSWQGLVIESLVVTPTRAVLDHVVFRYGGVSGYYGAQIYADNAVVTMTNSLLRDGLGSGFFGAIGSRLSIHDTQFISHAQDALRLEQPVHAPDLAGLSASGNNRNLVFVDSTTYLPGDQTWPAAGLPYLINSVFGNAQGSSLTIAPGAELRFTSTAYINIRGDFKAIGLPSAPITLTGETATPGAWGGLVLYGLTQPASAQLDYVTVEYGGQGISEGANVLVQYGNLVANHSIFRFSLKDGVRVDSGSGASMINGQFTGNTQYGVRNSAPSRWVLAANNYWGDPSGPTPDTLACGSGTGDKVTDGVLFQPVLTGTVPVEFPLVDAPSLSLTPRRWFAPADGQTKIYFDIVLRDPDGFPLPGRTVNIVTSLGSATSGGITDSNGHTYAYLVSQSQGSADVRAALSSSGCESALSPTARVTFDAPLNVVNLFPNAEAPYFDSGLSVSPMPVIVGISTTLTTRLTNPLTVPITVDVEFGYVQSSIGLAFGPISQVFGKVIPPQSTVQLSASFLPPISGHYCVDVSYTITGVGPGADSGLALAATGSGGRSQRNLDARPGGMGPPSDKDSLEKADASFKVMKTFAPRGTNIQVGLLTTWWGAMKDTASKISQALGFDPPRQDYDQITLPVALTLPVVQPDGNISPARASAINAATLSLADVTSYGRAAALALDRYAGASEANNPIWAAQQANARLQYEQQMGSALMQYADDLDAFRQVLINESETNVNISVSDVISYQTALQSTGFTPLEIAGAHAAGLTDADIEAYRLDIISTNPNDVAGNMLDFYADEAAAARALGLALLSSYSFSPGLGISGGAGLQPSTAVSNTLAQIDNTSATFVLGNPLTQTATIELRPRRLDLPADWTVTVSPGEVILAPGQQTIVTVTFHTGSLVAQGTTPRVAVEGYAGSTLLGGVVVDVLVPAYTPRFATYNLYLPVAVR